MKRIAIAAGLLLASVAIAGTVDSSRTGAPLAGGALDQTAATTNTNLGAPGATACATDISVCSINALLQRIAQRLTSILTALGSPMQQTGGSVSIIATSGSVNAFQQSCTTSATQLASKSFPNGFVLKALSTNVGTVSVGGSDDTAAIGYPLMANEAISYNANNSNLAYLICSNTTDKVAVTGS